LKNLLSPNIVNAIKNGKLNIDTAKSFPRDIHRLFASALYQDLFSAEDFKWRMMTFLTDFHCDLLLDDKSEILVKGKEISTLIRDKIMTLDAVTSLNQKQCL